MICARTHHSPQSSDGIRFSGIGVWIIINLIPLFTLEFGRESISIVLATCGKIWTIFLLGFVSWMVLLEYLLFSFSFGVLDWVLRSRDHPSFLRLLLFLLMCLGSAGYFFVLIGSWYFFWGYGSFPSTDTIRGMLHIGDLQTLPQILSERDLFLGSAFLVAALLVPLILFRMRMRFTSWLTVREELGRLAFVLFATGALTCSLWITSDKAERGLLLQIVDSTDPRLALFFRPMMANSHLFQLVQADQLNLLRRHTLEDYTASVAVPPDKDLYLFVIEALRSDVVSLTASGTEIMPFVNSLSRRGAFFPNSYSLSAESSYGQIGVLTGQHPVRLPVLDIQSKQPDYGYFNIYDLFTRLGYKAAYLTEQWRGTQRLLTPAAIDLYFDIRQHSPLTLAPFLQSNGTPDLIDEFSKGHVPYDTVAMNALSGWVRQNSDSSFPLMGAIYLYSSHFPYQQYSQVPNVFEAPSIPGSASFVRYPRDLADAMRRRYFNLLHHIDHLIENFIASAQRLRPNRDYVIAITGDHGELFHEHGFVGHNTSLFEEVIKVPLIIFDSERAVSGSERRVSIVSISPTLLDLLNLPNTAAFQTSSLFAAQGEQSKQPTASCSPPAIATNALLREYAVIFDNWKLVRSDSTGKESLFRLGDSREEQREVRAQHPKVAEALSDYLEKFLAGQFSFYLGDSSLRKQFFPPPIPCLADDLRQTLG